jgi:ribosomal protein S18 acetylase RimI-like enzyme
MIFRSPNKDESIQIAEIHKEEIKSGFLSTLNLQVLNIFYKSIIDSKEGICIVALDEGGKVSGFISGTTNIKKLYFNFFKNDFLYIVWLIAKEAVKPGVFKKFIELLFYPSKKSKKNKAELLTIAVKNNFQGQGLAGQILERFVAEMKKKNVVSFNVVVGKDLINAIKFYEKSGFLFSEKTLIHSGKESLIYIYNIK